MFITAAQYQAMFPTIGKRIVVPPAAFARLSTSSVIGQHLRYFVSQAPEITAYESLREWMQSHRREKLVNASINAQH